MKLLFMFLFVYVATNSLSQSFNDDMKMFSNKGRIKSIKKYNYNLNETVKEIILDGYYDRLPVSEVKSIKHFNRKGHLVKYWGYNRKEELLYRIKIKIRCKNKNCLKTAISYDSNKNSNGYTISYYNNFGDSYLIIHYNANGQVNRRESFTYDENRNLIEKKVIFPFFMENNYKYQYWLDNHSNVIEYKLLNDVDSIVGTEHNYYNNDGNIIYKAYNETSASHKLINYTYENGILKKETTYFKNQADTVKIDESIYLSNDYGDVYLKKFESNNGRISLYDYIYFPNGKIKMETLVQKFNESVINYKYKYKYDIFGNWISIITLRNDKPFSMKKREIEYWK